MHQKRQDSKLDTVYPLESNIRGMSYEKLKKKLGGQFLKKKEKKNRNQISIIRLILIEL